MKKSFAIWVFALALIGLLSCPKQPAENETVEAEGPPEFVAPEAITGKCPPGMGWIPPVKVCIDLFEYPNTSGEIPLAGVTYDEAGGICKELGKRLPTAEEWEAACTGPKKLDYIYPYGEEYIEGACWDDWDLLMGPAASGHLPKCVSPFGIYDMTGNVWEWTKSDGFEKGTKYVRGGSWYSYSSVATCTGKAWEPPDEGGKDYGFRCALNP